MARALMMVCAAVVLVTATGATVATSSAFAFEKLCVSGESGFTENNAGSQGAWCDGTSTDKVDFSQAETEAIKRRIEGVGMEGGASGDSPVTIPGETTADGTVDANVVYKMRGYGSEVGKDIADGWTKYMEKDNFLPQSTSILTRIGQVAMLGQAFLVGWKIGSAFRGWIGLDGTTELGITGCSCGVQRYEWVPGTEGTIRTNIGTGESGTGNNGAVAIPSTGVELITHSGYGYDIEQRGWLEGYQQYTGEKTGNCSPEAFKYSWQYPEWFETPNGATVQRSKEWTRVYCTDAKGNEQYVKLYVDAAWVGPAPGEGGMTVPTFPGSTVTPPGTVAKEVEVPAPEKHSVAPPVPTFPGFKALRGTTTKETKEVVREVIRESPEVKPGVPTAPQEEKELLIPTADPNETGIQYKERLEKAGFTKVELRTLPEASIDPKIGPEKVSYTSPSEGTKALPEAEVKIEQNPANAPTPSEGGPLFSAPTAQLKLPSFGAVCKSFPFGAPCWFVKTIEKWSAVGKAPVLTVPFFGGKSSMVVNLAVVEPAMEVLRPVFAIAVTIGLVWTFFSFALGGSGGGGDD